MPPQTPLVGTVSQTFFVFDDLDVFWSFFSPPASASQVLEFQEMLSFETCAVETSDQDLGCPHCCCACLRVSLPASCFYEMSVAECSCTHTHMRMHILSVNSYATHMCLVPVESRKGIRSLGVDLQIIVRTTVWVVETKPRSSAGVASAPIS